MISETFFERTLREETWKRQQAEMRKIYRKEQRIAELLHTPVPVRPTATELRAVTRRQRRIAELHHEIAGHRAEIRDLPARLAESWEEGWYGDDEELLA